MLTRTPLRRRTPLRSRSAKAAQRHAEQFGAQAELCRLGPCQACGRKGRCDPHHFPQRPRGKDIDTCALCRYCHNYFHLYGRRAFEARYGRTVASMVKEMRERLAARQAGNARICQEGD